MGTVYGKSSILITPNDINNVIVDNTGRTTYTVTTAANGGAIVTVDMLADLSNSCASNNGVFIELKDTIEWTRLYVRFISTGVASCWGWNGNNGYGSGFTSTQAQGNLRAYNESLGDFTKNEFNVWNLPQFQKYFSACDNNSTNYMHSSFQVGTSRGFDMFCRRNNTAVLAGPSHGRTCSNTGSLIISDMRISK
jgi:hypothetical protein